MKTVHRLAHGFLLVILALPLLLATPGCTRQTGTTHPTSPAMHLKAAHTLDEALKLAFGTAGPEAKVAVIPDGVSVIARKQRRQAAEDRGRK